MTMIMKRDVSRKERGQRTILVRTSRWPTNDH